MPCSHSVALGHLCYWGLIGFAQYPHSLFIAVSTLFHGFPSDWKLSSQIFSGPKNPEQVMARPRGFLGPSGANLIVVLGLHPR